MNSIEAKKGFLTFLVIIFLGVSVFFGARAVIQRTTSQRSQAAPSATPLNVTAQPRSPTQITITWQTKTESAGAVHYGLTSDLASCQTVRENLPTTLHKVSLTGLIPATTYFYQIVESETKTQPSTKPYSFTTPAAETAPPTADETEPTSVFSPPKNPPASAEFDLSDPAWDLNGDGVVNSLDYALYLKQ